MWSLPFLTDTPSTDSTRLVSISRTSLPNRLLPSLLLNPVTGSFLAARTKSSETSFCCWDQPAVESLNRYAEPTIWSTVHTRGTRGVPTVQYWVIWGLSQLDEPTTHSLYTDAVGGDGMRGGECAQSVSEGLSSMPNRKPLPHPC